MSSEISPKDGGFSKSKDWRWMQNISVRIYRRRVVIGDNCIIFPFVSILKGTRMGNGNKVHQGSVLAALPQDFNFVGEKSELIIGDNNIFVRMCSKRATHRGCKTVIGSNNFFMEGAHISHDTVVGDGCVSVMVLR